MPEKSSVRRHAARTRVPSEKAGKRKTERRATVHRFLRKDAIFRGETGRFQQETTCFGVFHKNELVVKKVLKQDNFFQKFEKKYLLAQ